MATKKPKDAPQQEQPILSVPLAEARDRINTQIAKGKQILTQPTTNDTEVKLMEENYKKWNDFNGELLRFLFSGHTRILKDYEWHALVPFQSGGGIMETIRFNRERTRRAIAALESLEQKLDLIPERQSRQTTIGSPGLPDLSDSQTGYRATPVSNANKIFIVHGHDSGLKETVARFVSQLSLEPVILHEKPNEGNTIIEKFERHSRDVGFAIALLTPDDKGGAAVSDPATYNLRARQNVILELGYFIGALGRRKVCALYSQGVELPSDMDGLLYIPIDEVDGWRLKLAREIKASGTDVDLNKAM
jgi:predicted nucleotide-binding protein